ncbi:hypothetical protein SARC_07974 [Sphaeroforma arctica JP610]|uniref:Myb/SANT-like domain-containing protein n=1 Tax=Sphaeroforma arctica JP610 TaxID=667725 RepID=A0A0L0FUP2_9EUKA|nr:hypothetical protein SARC_07974 [Sphaeroforma arctica JP610]KNC79638.1 hypothetical protein SARC_07974 [Sphaeroforma arctica JP610]|eukprot:XP_014153540.1 hypothetical protein SARC_07974 [Sphaeroforma arctica JP610]
MSPSCKIPAPPLPLPLSHFPDSDVSDAYTNETANLVASLDLELDTVDDIKPNVKQDIKPDIKHAKKKEKCNWNAARCEALIVTYHSATQNPNYGAKDSSSNVKNLRTAGWNHISSTLQEAFGDRQYTVQALKNPMQTEKKLFVKYYTHVMCSHLQGLSGMGEIPCHN